MVGKYRVDGKKSIKLKDFPTADKGIFKNKEEGLLKLGENIEIISELQNKLYAEDTYSLLIILSSTSKPHQIIFRYQALHPLHVHG